MRSVPVLLLALFLLIGMVGCGTPQVPVGKQYTLTHSVEGEGTVTPISGMKYAAGTIVQLTPTPAYGWAFKSWDGPDAGSVVGSSGNYSILMDADKTITAVFEKLKHEVITMVTPEDGGTIELSIIDPVDPQDVTIVDHGQIISVFAQPAANYEFFRWESDLSGTENPTTMLIEGRTYIDAVFQPVTTGRVTGNNGTQGIAGVVLEYTGAANGQVTTDADGYFSIRGVSGSITITPKSAPGTLWIDAEPTNRQVIAPSANVNFSLASFKYVGAWSGQGTVHGMYGTFGNIALDAEGLVYLVENNSCHIKKFTSDGMLITTLDMPRNPDTSCRLLGSLAIDSSGNIFATSLVGHQLNKLNGSGQLVKSWGGYGTDAGQFDTPMGLAIDSSGDIYVVDNGNDRIQKFTNDGDYVLSWGSPGYDDGRFDSPSNIAIDDNDDIYVTDAYNYRVQKFDTGGNYLSNWGGAPGPTHLNLQYLSMATDPNGNVWVIKSQENQLLTYSPTGQQLHLVNLGTIGPDGSKLQFPGNMVISSQGVLYITDPNNNLVHQFVIED
ncbi:MAG TPA: hypothetical protein GXZ82_06995 [Firmicutes bacterium]|jgi:hypothetical protein|nr:hypothetical protein [Bacillota bacterium]